MFQTHLEGTGTDPCPRHNLDHGVRDPGCDYSKSVEFKMPLCCDATFYLSWFRCIFVVLSPPALHHQGYVQ